MLSRTLQATERNGNNARTIISRFGINIDGEEKNKFTFVEDEDGKVNVYFISRPALARRDWLARMNRASLYIYEIVIMQMKRGNLSDTH